MGSIFNFFLLFTFCYSLDSLNSLNSLDLLDSLDLLHSLDSLNCLNLFNLTAAAALTFTETVAAALTITETAAAAAAATTLIEPLSLVQEVNYLKPKIMTGYGTNLNTKNVLKNV